MLTVNKSLLAYKVSLFAFIEKAVIVMVMTDDRGDLAGRPVE
jgi:hypothetical protein